MFWYVVETVLLVAALFGCFVLGWKQGLRLGLDQRRAYEREKRRAR